MDSLINAAAHALAAGDPFRALKQIALRDDPAALALRGIAMAQMGDLERAKDLLKRAARGFGQQDELAQARCVVAQAEIALVQRDLGWPAKALDAARAVLIRRGDRVNAAHAGCLIARRLLLVGRIDLAKQALNSVDADALPPALRIAYELARAGVAIRALDTRTADAAIARATDHAAAAGIASLQAEVDGVARLLTEPAARITSGETDRLLRLSDVEALMASDAFIVDACRNVVGAKGARVSLASRPVLFALVRALGDGWPGDVSRDVLVRRAFRARQADESHRARLRVEIGRLRTALGVMAEVTATDQGFALSIPPSARLVVLAPIADEKHAAVLSMLADGEAWSSSALAIALGISARSAQRATADLLRAGKVQAFGEGRARRWMSPPIPGFPTTLLLPGTLSRG
jgi:tetratricopeptide (TPR) repeat protein